jgi:DNA-binding transcriptional LysR family regulator
MCGFRCGPVVWHLEERDGSSAIEVSGRFRANMARVVLRAAVAGLGVALLPELITAPDVAAGRLVKVLPRYRREGADLYAVCASRRQIPRGVCAFIEFAAEKFHSVPSGVSAIRRGKSGIRTPD